MGVGIQTMRLSLEECRYFLEHHNTVAICILFIVCDVSNAEQPKNSFSLFQRRTQKRTILYSLHSMTKTSYAARIPLTVQLLNGKYPVSQIYNCFISSFKLFHLVRTSVYCCSVTWPERYTEVHNVSWLVFLFRIYKLEILRLQNLKFGILSLETRNLEILSYEMRNFEFRNSAFWIYRHSRFRVCKFVTSRFETLNFSELKISTYVRFRG